MPDVVLRSLPSVDRLVRSLEQAPGEPRATHDLTVSIVRAVLDDERARRAGGAAVRAEDVLRHEASRRLDQLLRGSRRVINATGVILHTNLGRAPLGAEAAAAMHGAAGYVDLEVNLSTGARGSRQDAVGRLLCALTGAEAALVVTSNAASVLLALAALCRGRDVLVSRGEAVEIGGGFRVPAIMRASGARLLDVGTTNRTRTEDYAAAITARTAALLHVHASNFRITGFTLSPAVVDLAELAHARGLPLLVDNGSGSLLDTAAFGLAHEPTPLDALAAGADVVTFSGDKLLGGPQSGIILGRATLVDRVASHPLARAVRPDKLILAALAATLRAYARGDATTTLPVWQMISLSAEELAARARSFRDRAERRGLALDVRPGTSTVGGGSLPGETLPTALLGPPRGLTAARLRAGAIPVVARVQEGRTLLDLRTVMPEEEDDLLEALVAVAAP